MTGFAKSPPNEELLRFARLELPRVGNGVAVDIGCGAARNALPLARQGWRVLGVDRSVPMIETALRRVQEAGLESHCWLAVASMDRLPLQQRTCDLLIAHGIWNLARSDRELRSAMAEAARVARPGAALFVFTFSRHTLTRRAEPVAGESFVFTAFSGQPQCFLTEDQLVTELGRLGFLPDSRTPLRELNLPAQGALRTPSVPVIYEAAFRYVG